MALCPTSGEHVAPRDRLGSFADEAYCPECRALAPVFRTSEPRPTNIRYRSHEEPGR